jgi:hypothetical protein
LKGILILPLRLFKEVSGLGIIGIDGGGLFGMREEMKDFKLKQWHPMFLKSMRLALADAKPGQVEIQKEVPLSSKPLEIDIIVVKHNDDKKLQHPMAGIFRKWNIIEFKSPLDITAEELREVLKMGKQLTAKEKERFFEVLNSSPVTLE